MKRLLAYLFIVLGLGLTISVNAKENFKLTKNEVNSLFSSVNSCWSLPLGLPYNKDLSIKIKVNLDETGSVIRTEILDHSKINKKGNGYLKVLAESALRAIKLCSPLKVPNGKYPLWQQIVFNFDANEVLNGIESEDTKIAKNNLLNKTIEFNQTIKKEKVKKQKFSQFDFKANQIILINSNTNQILYEKNSDQKINPAGFTKIMTSIIVFDAIKNGQISLKDKLSVSEKAWKISTSGYSAMFVMNGDSISVENLLRGLIVASGNDAAIVLAEGLAGSENNFVKLMNDKAKEIGLNYTKFGNSTGIIIPTNTTTVKDVAIMSSYLINNYPELYYFFGEKQFTWNRTGGDPITQGNRNPLLYKNMNVDGLRTSYNQTDRYGLASSMYLKNNNDRLIVVGSGFKDKNARSKGSAQLLTLGKTNYHTFKIAKKEPSQTQKVASKEKVNLIFCKEFKNQHWYEVFIKNDFAKCPNSYPINVSYKEHLEKKAIFLCYEEHKNPKTNLLKTQRAPWCEQGLNFKPTKLEAKFDGKNIYLLKNELPNYLNISKKTQIAKAEPSQTQKVAEKDIKFCVNESSINTFGHLVNKHEQNSLCEGIDFVVTKNSNSGLYAYLKKQYIKNNGIFYIKPLLLDKYVRNNKVIKQKKKVEVAKKEPQQEEFKPKKTNQDNEAPVIQIAEAITVNDTSYILEGKVTDKADKIFVEIDGQPVQVKKGKFNVKRYSPVDEQIKIVAIDQWGNKSKTKLVSITIDIEETTVANKLEPLNPSNISNKSSNNKVALIIGIENYTEAPKANYANLDAKYFFDYARRAFGVNKQNINLLVNEEATVVKTDKAVSLWLKSKIKKNKSELIIFFAGHGLASSDGKELYLLPQDGNPDRLERTALSRTDLFKEIISLNPKSVTMFLDTCYSGVSRDEQMLLASARPVRIVADDQEGIPDNFTIFSASQLDQISSGLKEAKHGIFSYYLMKGLEGNADSNNDKKITNGELLAYMDENVSQKAAELGRQQNPSLAGNPDKVLISYR